MGKEEEGSGWRGRGSATAQEDRGAPRPGQRARALVKVGS